MREEIRELEAKAVEPGARGDAIGPEILKREEEIRALEAPDTIKRLREEIRELETEAAVPGARADIEADILAREAKVRTLESGGRAPARAERAEAPATSNLEGAKWANLQKNLERYRKMRDVLQNLPPTPGAQINARHRDVLYKIAVLEQLLDEGEINASKLEEELQGKYGDAFDLSALNSAVTAIDNYVKDMEQENTREKTSQKGATEADKDAATAEAPVAPSPEVPDWPWPKGPTAEPAPVAEAAPAAAEATPGQPAPVAEAPGREAPAVERGRTRETAAGRVESAEVRNLRAGMSLENQGFFNKMTEGGRDMFIRACEATGLDGISAFSNTIDKLGVAYNRFWGNRHEMKAAELKAQMDGLDAAIAEMRSGTGAMEGEGIGAEMMKVGARRMDQQIEKMLNEKDKLQSNFEYRHNKVTLYTNERDRIADKLIGRYDEKLAPMEKRLESLKARGDEVALTVAVTEAKHSNELLRLQGIEDKQMRIEEAMRRGGFKPGEIRDATAVFAEIVKNGRAEIRKEKDRLAKQKNEIDKKIAKVDDRANPYRDKRENFVRVKNDRPVKMEAAARTRGRPFTGTEEVQTHPRAEGPEPGEAGGAGGAGGSPEAAEVGVETAEGGPERFKAGEFVSEWNKYLKEKYKTKGEYEKRAVVLKDFLRATKLDATFRLEPKSFKNILEKYSKVKKLPMDTLSKDIDDFFSGK